MAVCDEVDRLKARVAELEALVPPQERGANRYGLDMAYFRNLFNRELNRPLVDFTPSELARVLARAARTADPAVLQEPEFQSNSWLLIKQAEAVERVAEDMTGMNLLRPDEFARMKAQRLRKQAGEAERAGGDQ